MHEATIAKSILESAVKRAASFSQVVCINVRIGEFRNVDPESLTFSFDCLKQEFSLLLDTELRIDWVPALAHCRENAHNYKPIADQFFACPTCGSGIGNLVAGKELEITGFIVAEQTEKEEYARNC